MKTKITGYLQLDLNLVQSVWVEVLKTIYRSSSVLFLIKIFN
ncbi:MAG: hypothetical protein WCS37_16880 [Chloroflexota bacterium]